MDKEQTDHSTKRPVRAEGQGGPSVSDAVPPKLRDPAAQLVWEAESAVRQAEANRLDTLLKYVASKTEQARREARDAYERLQIREAPPEVMHLCARSGQHDVEMAERAAFMYAADALKCSEHHVIGLHHAACQARTHLPRVWKSFLAGRMTTYAMRSITQALDRSLKDETIDELDAKAAEYATRWRPGQLNSWLRRFTAQAEPADAAERFTRAAKGRYVGVKDLDDGMSLLTALLPTITARSIKQKLEAVSRSPKQAVPHNPLIATQEQQQQQRLELTQALHQWMWDARHPDDPHPTASNLDNWEISQAAQELARSLQDSAPAPENDETLPQLCITDGAPIGQPESPAENAADPEATPAASGPPETREDGDPRTIEQRAADTFTAWLLSAESADGIEIEAHVGILVPESTVTGASDQSAITRDGRSIIPGPHIRDMLRAQRENLTWFEIGVAAEPEQPPDISDNILSFRSAGRYPPPRLRAAILFRDGTCRADGCQTAAEVCDVDHVTPWPEGSTSADNLQVLCRRHHRLKTAGYDIASRYARAA